MKHYLILLNWVLLAAIAAVIIWPAPLITGQAFSIGLILGACITCGMVTLQYVKDTAPEKEWKWRRNYFRKDYTVEIALQFLIVGCGTILSTLFWRTFFLFVTGFASAWLINILTEWLWAVTHRYYNNKV